MRKFIHDKTGNIYTVLRGLVPSSPAVLAQDKDGSWVPSIVYTRENTDDDDKIYVRSVLSFFMKFTEVNEDE